MRKKFTTTLLTFTCFRRSESQLAELIAPAPVNCSVTCQKQGVVFPACNLLDLSFRKGNERRTTYGICGPLARRVDPELTVLILAHRIETSVLHEDEAVKRVTATEGL